MKQMLIERPLVVKQLAVGGLIRELSLVPFCLDVKGQGVEEWEAKRCDRPYPPSHLTKFLREK
ncbi:hypothetical protein [Trichormus sp. NMC-1]|uniref:hypothetical protein n=1 Tax=Trichormus sp. NMC-1 TaxID=1853259 RepID=UPI0008DC216C|nr:hypothetical protein [Trichormus sp. NMC-1]